MDKRTLRVLEYDKIIEMLAAYAASEGGRERILTAQPQSQESAVARLLAETAEAEWVVTRSGRSPIDRFRNPEEAAGRAAVGAILGPEELLRVASFLKAVIHARSEIRSLDGAEGAQRLSADILALVEHKSLFQDILRCIDADGNITDEAKRGTGPYPALDPANPPEDQGDAAEDDQLPGLPEIPPGAHRHPAQRPVCAAGEAGAQERDQGDGPRPVRNRGHPLCGACVGGGAQ